MNDQTSNEGPGAALIAAANATGVPTTIKGKVQRAIFRLIVGIVNPDNIEPLRQNASTLEGRSRIDAMVAEEIGRQAIADPDFMERAKARFLGELAQKQDNVEAVAAKAQAKLENDVNADQEALDPSAEPTQDWMNAFIREAECATSEELRERLAALLAGEAKMPGSYSRSTVRFIAELEQETLMEFQKVLTHRAGDFIIRDTSWSEGPDFVRAVLLEDEGLISGSAGFTHQKMSLDENGNAFLMGEIFALVATGDGAERQVPVYMLTRTGREVASLLPPTDERQVIRALAGSIDKNGISAMFMGRIVRLAGEAISVSQDEVLWPPAAPVMNIAGGTHFRFN